VIAIITDDDLAKYLPKFGDRLAIKNFVNHHFMTDTQKEDRKRRLVSRLKTELEKKNG
jgi:hypothetical protein